MIKIVDYPYMLDIDQGDEDDLLNEEDVESNMGNDTEEVHTDSTKYFIIDDSHVEIYPIHIEPYGYASPIEIHDSMGAAFVGRQKPTLTSLYLTDMLSPLRPDSIRTRDGVDHEQARLICVDPRVLMAHILTWWAFPLDSDDQELSEFAEALNPIPALDEAREWMERNRFGGDNAFHEPYNSHAPGYWIAQDTHLQYVPDKVRNFVLKTRGSLPSGQYPWEPYRRKEQ